MRGLALTVIIAAFLALSVDEARPQVLGTIDLGLIKDSLPVTAVYTLWNPSPDKVARVDLLSACSCLTVSPDRLMLDPGESRQVRVTYLPEGTAVDGGLARTLLVKSNLPELDNRRVAVTGSFPVSAPTERPAASDCDECRKMEELFSEERQLADFAERVVLVDFYFDPGCAKCEEYLARDLPRATRGSARVVRLARHSILEPAELAQLMRRLEGARASLAELPVAFVGDRPFQGLEAIESAVARALVTAAR